MEFSEDIAMSVTRKLITGVAVAATLVATVAVARTQLRTTGTKPAYHGTVFDDYVAARRHGLVACPALVETNCDALEMMLPQ
jgi:hypothetical protein